MSIFDQVSKAQYSEEQVRIRCKIHRGAFSCERGIEVVVGNETYDGVIPVDYLTTAESKQLTEQIPRKGETLDGFASAQLLRIASTASIRFPDGTTITVSESVLKDIVLDDAQQ